MWKPFKTLRENWKKSIFFSCVAAYGVHLIDQRIKINKLMRVYCEEAASFGNQPWNHQRQLKHLTIILNPVANQRKGKKLFFSYAQPILNCAGIKCSLIETEHEGQARDYMEVMSNTDGVIIVGGDGTIHEAITGYLRRDDSNKKKSLSLGFIPVGKRNSGMFKLFEVDLDSNGRIRNKVDHIDLIGRLSMSIVKETTKPIDVIKIEGKDRGKPVYALNSFDFGKLADYLEPAESYWLFSTRIKPYYPLSKKILFKGLSSQSIPAVTDILYTKPCSGCAKCYENFKEPVEEEAPKRWWHLLIPRPTQLKQKLKPANIYDSYKDLVNEECGVWHKVESNDLINLSIRNSFNKKISMNLHKVEDCSKQSLIQDGVNIFREKDDFKSNVQKIEARDISINLTTDQPNSDVVSPDTQDLKFNIDRENYEAQSVLLSLLPNRISVYS
ncbi:acylglycerol kinase, mitochondrial isoform X2 [Tetranychus urticae]|uniref:DAGKc domain-containing protein n=2 Tax=Tetranychus urticae TaxID=32264 RepID=T1KDQ8_TETUR|nr:acylglycerol kinase, mitochondrial isoform X2 [Tetranychus urticae]